MLPFVAARAGVHYLEETQRQIDNEIETLLDQAKHLLEQARQLRERRNELSLVAWLPAETLASIFRDCLPDPESKPTFPTSHVFTRVCRHWRQVALGAAALWTTVPCATPELTRTFLTRSKDAPLFFRVTRGMREDIDHTGSLDALKHVERIRVLILQHEPYITKNEEILTARAPLLEKCDITAPGLYNVRIALPDRFLDLYAPKMCHLRLECIYFKWQMLHHDTLVRGLTSLELRQLPLACCPSGQELVTALESMPSLHSLVIDVAARRSDRLNIPSVARTEPARLRQLINLELSGPGACICDMLRHIKVPSTAKISLVLSDSVQPSDFNTLSAFLENHCTCSGKGPIVQRLFYRGWSSARQLRAYATLYDIPGDDPLLNLSIQHEWEPSLDFMRQLRLDELVSVSVDARLDHIPLVKRFLELCGNAIELRITDVYTCEMILPLLLSPSHLLPNLLPRLRQIHMRIVAGERASLELVEECERLSLERQKAFNIKLKWTLSGTQYASKDALERFRQMDINEAEVSN